MQEFGLDVTRSAALSILPWGVNVVCTNLAGWLGDKAVNERGLDRTLVRKVMQGIASLGPAACLLALASDQGAPLFPSLPTQVWLCISSDGTHSLNSFVWRF